MGFANPQQERVYATSPSYDINSVPSGSVLAIDYTIAGGTLTAAGEWSWGTGTGTGPSDTIQFGGNAGDTWLTVSSFADYLGPGIFTEAGLVTKVTIGAAIGPSLMSVALTGDLAEQTPGDPRTLELTATPGAGTAEWTVDLSGIYPALSGNVVTFETGWPGRREVLTAPWSTGTWVQKRYTPRKPR